MAWSRQVAISSTVAEVAWDDGEMLVTFNNGTAYAYSGVDEDTAIALSKAPSVGQMLYSEIRGQYPTRRVR
jgi:hypothetical protein